MINLEKIKNTIKQQRFIINYKRMWPYVKPIWFRALLSLLICIPIGSLDAIIALALKPYMDLVMVEKSISSPWYIPLGIVAFNFDVEVVNGHDMAALETVFKNLRKKKNGKPEAVIAKTVRGYGSKTMIENDIWFHKSPNEEELELLTKEVDLAWEEHF